MKKGLSVFLCLLFVGLSVGCQANQAEPDASAEPGTSDFEYVGTTEPSAEEEQEEINFDDMFESGESAYWDEEEYWGEEAESGHSSESSKHPAPHKPAPKPKPKPTPKPKPSPETSKPKPAPVLKKTFIQITDCFIDSITPKESYVVLETKVTNKGNVSVKGKELTGQSFHVYQRREADVLSLNFNEHPNSALYQNSLDQIIRPGQTKTVYRTFLMRNNNNDISLHFMQDGKTIPGQYTCEIRSRYPARGWAGIKDKNNPHYVLFGNKQNLIVEYLFRYEGEGTRCINQSVAIFATYKKNGEHIRLQEWNRDFWPEPYRKQFVQSNTTQCKKGVGIYSYYGISLPKAENINTVYLHFIGRDTFVNLNPEQVVAIRFR